MRRSLLLVVPVVAALLLGACGSSGGSSNDSGAPTLPPAIYTISALSATSTKLLDAYKAEHSDTKLVVKGGDKASLVKIMAAKFPGVALVPETYVPAEIASKARVIGNNTIVLATPTGSSAVTNLDQFKALPPARRSQCVVYVPADCTLRVTQQVAAKQIDAAAIWRTSGALPTGVKITAIPEDQSLVFNVSSVLMGDSSEAKSFDDFLKSDKAKKILTEQGLLP